MLKKLTLEERRLFWLSFSLVTILVVLGKSIVLYEPTSALVTLLIPIISELSVGIAIEVFGFVYLIYLLRTWNVRDDSRQILEELQELRQQVTELSAQVITLKGNPYETNDSSDS